MSGPTRPRTSYARKIWGFIIVRFALLRYRGRRIRAYHGLDRSLMTTFVLVHGMSHGGWAWASLAARLERDGHRIIAIDLPGHGRRAHERGRVTVDRYAAAVADAMMLDGAHDAVVVGHSMGGVVIPKVAELVPARVRHLVFLAAVVLPSGGSLLETQMTPATPALFRGLARSGGGAVQYPAAIEWA